MTSTQNINTLGHYIFNHYDTLESQYAGSLDFNPRMIMGSENFLFLDPDYPDLLIPGYRFDEKHFGYLSRFDFSDPNRILPIGFDLRNGNFQSEDINKYGNISQILDLSFDMITCHDDDPIYRVYILSNNSSSSDSKNLQGLISNLEGKYEGKFETNIPNKSNFKKYKHKIITRIAKTDWDLWGLIEDGTGIVLYDEISGIDGDSLDYVCEKIISAEKEEKYTGISGLGNYLVVRTKLNDSEDRIKVFDNEGQISSEFQVVPSIGNIVANNDLIYLLDKHSIHVYDRRGNEIYELIHEITTPSKIAINNEYIAIYNHDTGIEHNEPALTLFSMPNMVTS